MSIDNVSNPDHYTQYPMEVIELTEHMNFCRGNAVERIALAGFEDPSKEIEDLLKAEWYIRREIERLKKDKLQNLRGPVGDKQ